MHCSRRDFLACAAALTATSTAKGMCAAASTSQPLRLAPRLGQFRGLAGDDPASQLGFLADRGFSEADDGAFASRPLKVQRQLARELGRLGMRLGSISGPAEFSRATFASGDRGVRRRLLSEVDRTLESACRGSASAITIVPGRWDSRLPHSSQQSNAVDLLRRCAERCDSAGVDVCLEPVDAGRSDSPLLAPTISDAVRLCREVNSPRCCVLCDVYSWSTASSTAGGGLRSAGELIELLDRHWGEIGLVRLADAPGGKEPGTGMLDFPAIVRFLQARRYRGLLVMEHGASLAGKRGERAVLDAYSRLFGLPALASV